MKRGLQCTFFIFLALFIGVFQSPAWAQERLQTTPGELIVENPTLINLGFEWRIEGDANRNASVTVSYRRVGDQGWTQGMPLLRLQGERIEQKDSWNLVVPNMFAGSILDLEPGTAYEARFQLTDLDGVRRASGGATRTVTVRTRPEPQPAKDGKVYHVYPKSFQGPRQVPYFDSIMCAYNYVCGAGDTSSTGRPRVRPGDVILVHAGEYSFNYDIYGNGAGTPGVTVFEGTAHFTADGTPDRPIVIKGAGDGEVILDGNGAYNLFNVKAADYNYFEGLTFRNTEIAIWAGTQFQSGSKGLTVKNSRFENVGMGVYTNYSGSSDFYIADNVFIGRHDQHHVIGFQGAFWAKFATVDGQRFPPLNESYTAVRLYGPGHVVAYNYIAHFHDAVDIETYGNPDGSSAIDGPSYPPREYWDRRPVAIDIYNNYMTNFHDNAVEADGGLHNIRIMRNVMLNSASHPFCNQPVGGGPVYWIRNIVYHAPDGSTRLSSGAAGAIFYNNTILTETAAPPGGQAANVHWMNNLMLGENVDPEIFSVVTSTSYSSSDYNGFRPNPTAKVSFVWKAPGGDSARPTQFATLKDYAAASGQDQHSVLVDYDVFQNVPRLDAQDAKTVQTVWDGLKLDFRLKPASAAVDKGGAIPNVTDGFGGAAPDLGALEVGKPTPIYGPRGGSSKERISNWMN